MDWWSWSIIMLQKKREKYDFNIHWKIWHKLRKTWFGHKKLGEKVLKICPFSLSEIATQRNFKTLNSKNKRWEWHVNASYRKMKKIEKKSVSIYELIFVLG